MLLTMGSNNGRFLARLGFGVLGSGGPITAGEAGPDAVDGRAKHCCRAGIQAYQG